MNLIWFSPHLFPQHMKGKFDDDDWISSQDAKKTLWVKFRYILLSIFLPSFTCLIIRVSQEAERTTLHKEKWTQKKPLKLLHEQKIFLIARNISSTKTLQHCLHYASSNMAAVNFFPDQWYALLNISYANNLLFV